VNTILANPATDPASAHFQFAAKTLHDKICCDFDELPEPQRLALREAISSHVMQWGLRPGVPRPVLRRLAMCAAALAVQMEWKEVFAYVVNLGSQAPPGQEVNTLRLVLELLAALPDQCNDMSMRCADENRANFQSLLDQNQGDVLAFLATNGARAEVSANAEAATALLRCFADWVSAYTCAGSALLCLLTSRPLQSQNRIMPLLQPSLMGTTKLSIEIWSLAVHALPVSTMDFTSLIVAASHPECFLSQTFYSSYITGAILPRRPFRSCCSPFAASGHGHARFLQRR